ncbi:MAG TPA: tetratricopeptide repeat protein [Acetivibrio sp.]|uniref:tetratricopeptide repeat protein n=1 Tax=Acetivibrio sp. TaxID=1872092 RepID=UPI002BA61DEB|nr:tetratricopeptide repeat protein [Acetivibrio sp.]HOM01556.1 tetratricopeptide repeat protein [Acetivibrio sp.]
MKKRLDNKIDIRISKYEKYVKKHPKKAYGYYCIGNLHMEAGNYKLAEKYFKKSLEVDGNYTLSIIGLIEAYVFGRKFLKAIYLFSQNRQKIIDKYIYRVKLVRGVTSFYSKTDLFRTEEKDFLSEFFLKRSMRSVKKLVDSESNNIVLKLILCMYCLHTKEKSFYIIQMFKTCIYWDGLEDTFRWALINRLSQEGEKLYYDINIARKFTTVPDASCSDEYVDMIFSSALDKGNGGIIADIYDSAGKYNKKISPRLMWRYIQWSMQNSFYDPSVFDCCNKLVKMGWMDNVIANTMLKFKEKNAAKLGEENERTLRLFGYMN